MRIDQIGVMGFFRMPNKDTIDLKNFEPSVLEQGGGFDTVSFSGTKSEKFDDVRAEMDKNVPDQTTTIEEKELAISYIDRMLACDDIEPELKTYWQNKKNVIEMEIQNIKNGQSAGKNENWQALEEEFSQFTQKYWVEKVLNNEDGLDSLDFYDGQEYYITVRRTMISFCDRILACSDLPNDKKEYYNELKLGFMSDLNSYSAQANEYNKTNNNKTESFDDVYNEFNAVVPDRTSTIGEKVLALSYIERMLSCDDITPELRSYWQNKQTVLEMEIQNINNIEQNHEGEKVEDVWKEFSEFTDRFFDSINDNMTMDEKYENRIAYYNTYKSFIARLMNCSDVTEEQRAEYSRMEYNADFDLSNWEYDYHRYKYGE